MLIGPVFRREAAIAPRRTRTYIARSGYILSLLILMWTAWLVLTGTQRVGNIGDLARFGTILFQILAPLQLALALFFSGMLAASAVAQEKDRHTLLLLLLTNLSNSELVLGKLLASLLSVLMMLVAALPVFMLSSLLGGVSWGQIARVFAVTAAAVLVCGSLGSTLALWREKTFQALAMTVLVLVMWLAIWEIVASGALGAEFWGRSCRTWAIMLSPWQAVVEATRPYDAALGPLGSPVYLFLVMAGFGSIVLNGVAIVMVRVWNPSRETRRITREEDARRGESIWSSGQTGGETEAAEQAVSDVATATERPASKAGSTRRVWDNPILWREIRTWAYGRKILVIRLAYLAIFALAAATVYRMAPVGMASVGGTGSTTEIGMVLVSLFLLSLVLVNAQAVTSLTTERDGRALDLLLVTDLTPSEIVFGKLGGVFYNSKEMVVLPMLLCVYLCFAGVFSLENLVYLLIGLGVLYIFVAVLGIHSGMVYSNSQAAIGISLGTVFFLFVGMAVCMWMLVAFSGSFQAQLQPFLAFMIGGGVGLYVALGARNPSLAIGVASFVCPAATFYAMTSFLLDYTLGVLLVIVAAYGFATAAMLIPALYEFDIATGRTTIEE